MLEWRRRREPSKAMLYLSPLIAIGLTMLTGMLVFGAIGYDGLRAVTAIFITPLIEPQRWADLGVKAAPLIMIALGLALGFRANVWNIGAEGQYVMGAIAGTGVALLTHDMTGWWILPATMCSYSPRAPLACPPTIRLSARARTTSCRPLPTWTTTCSGPAPT